MSAIIRAHRILKKLPRYVDCRGDSTPIFSEKFPELGSLIGVYKDREHDSSAISIFENGLSWQQDDTELSIEYKNISSVELPAAKDGRSLVLNRATSDSLTLPITGGDGKFRDSLEFLRFLDRVLADQTMPLSI
jgi:hypothetical protein